MLARSLFMILLYVLNREVNIVYYIITRARILNFEFGFCVRFPYRNTVYSFEFSLLRP